MKNEVKTRLKILILLVVMILAAATILMSFYASRRNLQESKKKIEQYETSLALIKKLILAVDDAQELFHVFNSLNEGVDTEIIESKILSIDSITSALAVIHPDEENALSELSDLVNKEKENFLSLNTQLQTENPVDLINKKLKNASPVHTNKLLKINIHSDSTKTAASSKGFFRRLGEAFKPRKEITEVTERADTIRQDTVDSIMVIIEAARLAEIASLKYDHNILNIITRINELFTSNNELSNKINLLLYDMHDRMLSAAIVVIGGSENVVGKNYNLSLVSGIIALLLICLFIIMIITDINKVQKSRNYLEQANKKVKEVMESRHQLMLSTSHDIKSPLNSILGYLEMSPQKTDEVQSMQNSAKYILSLLENMLNFSSIEQGTLTITNTKFSVKELMSDLSEMFYPLAQAKKLKFSYSASDVDVESDVMKIRQILTNLISNAVKYTTKGGITIGIASIQNNGSNGLHITVSDTGAGIAPDEVDKLFMPFTRIERNNKLASGSGYGMYVVKGLVNLLGGTIKVESELTKGTTFIVDIPVVLVNDCKAEPKKIVVFDDEQNIVKVAEKMLVQLGHTVVEDEYDMILTDLDMNDITGLDVLESAGDIPVVLMSGRSDISEEWAKSKGFAAFIPKPLTIELLKSVFGDAVGSVSGSN